MFIQMMFYFKFSVKKYSKIFSRIQLFQVRSFSQDPKNVPPSDKSNIVASIFFTELRKFHETSAHKQFGMMGEKDTRQWVRVSTGMKRNWNSVFHLATKHADVQHRFVCSRIE